MLNKSFCINNIDLRKYIIFQLVTINIGLNNINYNRYIRSSLCTRCITRRRKNYHLSVKIKHQQRR